MTTIAGRRFDPFLMFLALACLVLAVVASLLARENRSLKFRLAQGIRPPSLEASALKVGDIVRPFPVVDGTGHESTIGFGEGEAKTILLVFSSTCPACKATIPKWKEVFGSGASSSVRILSVQTDHPDPAGGAEASVMPSLPFPVYRQQHPDGELMKKVPFIPATVILDPKGVVTQAWFGVPTPEQEEELRRTVTTATACTRGRDTDENVAGLRAAHSGDAIQRE
jgi:hypothetical protein